MIEDTFALNLSTMLLHVLFGPMLHVRVYVCRKHQQQLNFVLQKCSKQVSLCHVHATTCENLMQVGFFKVVAMPLFAKFFSTFPALDPLLEFAHSNYNHWCDLDTARATTAGNTK